MDKFTQLRAKLLSLDLDNKEEILSNFDDAVNENDNIKKDIVTQRDNLKTELKSTTENLNLAKKTLGIEELNEDNLKSVLSNAKVEESELREQISKQYEDKYTNDMTTLTSQLEELKTQNADITNKYNDNLFVNGVVNSGLLDSFVDDKDARDNIIIPKLKDKFIYKDNQIFVKDPRTGDIATVIGTDKPLDPASVVNKLKENISPIYLKPQANANGMPMSPNQTRTENSGGKVDSSKYKDVGQAMKDGFASLNK